MAELKQTTITGATDSITSATGALVVGDDLTVQKNLNVGTALYANGVNFSLKTYPVGTIYQSTVNTNPGTLFAGVWVSFNDQFAETLTLVGYYSSSPLFATVNMAIIGSTTVQLTNAMIPSHSHTGGTTTSVRPSLPNQNIGGRRNWGYGRADSVNYRWISGTGLHSHTYYTGDGGNGSESGYKYYHNNIQPSIIVYTWYRQS